MSPLELHARQSFDETLQGLDEVLGTRRYRGRARDLRRHILEATDALWLWGATQVTTPDDIEKLMAMRNILLSVAHDAVSSPAVMAEVMCRWLDLGKVRYPTLMRWGDYLTAMTAQGREPGNRPPKPWDPPEPKAPRRGRLQRLVLETPLEKALQNASA